MLKVQADGLLELLSKGVSLNQNMLALTPASASYPRSRSLSRHRSALNLNPERQTPLNPQS